MTPHGNAPEHQPWRTSVELVHLSSTKVRKKAAAGEGVGGMVPAAVEARIAELYSR